MATLPPVRLNLVFRGRVQGVGFRARTQEMAQRHRVTGWVRNEPDGSVRCLAEGEGGEVEAFLGDLLGSMSRYVESHEKDVMPAGREFSSFTIQS